MSTRIFVPFDHHGGGYIGNDFFPADPLPPPPQVVVIESRPSHPPRDGNHRRHQPSAGAARSSRGSSTAGKGTWGSGQRNR